MEGIPPVFWQFVTVIIGAVAAYFGAMNAIRENLARLGEQIKNAKENADEAKQAAAEAHSRINRMLESPRVILECPHRRESDK